MTETYDYTGINDLNSIIEDYKTQMEDFEKLFEQLMNEMKSYKKPTIWTEEEDNETTLIFDRPNKLVMIREYFCNESIIKKFVIEQSEEE